MLGYDNVSWMSLLCCGFMLPVNKGMLQSYCYSSQQLCTLERKRNHAQVKTGYQNMTYWNGTQGDLVTRTRNEMLVLRLCNSRFKTIIKYVDACLQASDNLLPDTRLIKLISAQSLRFSYDLMQQKTPTVDWL